MILTIDAGNTRTKWALFDDTGEIIHQDACLNAHIANANLLLSSLTCDEIIISNVAGADHAQQLQQLVISCQATTFWFAASKQLGNVINNYTTPELLGSDRWAALIGAWHMQMETCVVVNAGTATTIDAIVKTHIDGETFGVFMGGMIIPGVALMQISLGTATAQLPSPADNIQNAPLSNANPFATNTVHAIYNGALIATAGAIEHMAQAIKNQYGHAPAIIISGGNAELIQHNLMNKNFADKDLAATDLVTTDLATTHIDQPQKAVTIVENLVLQGLYLYTKM